MLVLRYCVLVSSVQALLSPSLRIRGITPSSIEIGSDKSIQSSQYHPTSARTSTSTSTRDDPLYSTKSEIDTNTGIPKADARAGEDGYSLLRQPLTWDSSVDPTFETPISIDENEDDLRNKNADWFGAKSQSGSSVMGDAKMRLQGDYSFDENDGEDNSLLNKPKKRKMEFEQTLDLFQRTLDTLDYPIVLKALKENCGTAPAKQIVDESTAGSNNSDNLMGGKKNMRKAKRDENSILNMGLTAKDVQGAHERYQAVSEMRTILAGDAEIPRNAKTKAKAKRISGPPLSSSNFDISPMMEKVDEGGVLDGPDILEMGTILRACVKVSDWCSDLERAQIWKVAGLEDEDADKDEEEPFKEIPKLGRYIFVDFDLLDLLDSAFDDDGRLSGTTFQGIGRLRAKVRTLKADILSTLDTIMSSPSVKNKLSLESGGSLYSEVNGRIVIPVQEKYKSSVGIIHDSSRSGKTAYVEPSEVVGPTNEMNQAVMELRQEEMKVWRMLTKKIMDNRDDIEQSIIAVAQLDLVLARLRLADRISGVIPKVADEGVISLKCAKHPVLLLRELENVVGSDIDIGSGNNQGLVLTGPNSGGKTVILKLMGLCALMARDGIPIPCEPEDARVDFFGPVLADIGDIQSVDDDLSTFSGHMLVCREVLASSGQNALVLMDELGSGTDPNQGVAIAQSILEALMSSGSRVAITTHYLQLKQLATSDNRFSVGAMQFVNGRPTYKLLPGVIGESFALSVAERLNLPQAVIDRASELMDSDTKQMGDLIRNMEDQKLVIDQQALELKQKRKELDELEQAMLKKQEKLERQQVNARREEAKKFAAKLEEKEVILQDIMQTLKSNPSKKLIAKSWDELRYVKRDALTEAENIPSVLRKKEAAAAVAAERFAEMVPLAELREKPNLKAGDILVICKKGALSGKEATVINVSGKRVAVNVSGMQMQMKLTEVALRPTSFVPEAPKSNNKGNKMSKMAQKALAQEMEAGGGGLGPNTSAKVSGGPTMRVSSNTVDCIGCNFEAARRKCEDKFSKVMTSKNPVVFILHGHGTQGVLKSKLRTWLGRDKQWVKKWSSADKEDGGDAFTRVELKNSLLL